MKLFNTIAASVAVAMAAGVAQADVNSQLASLQAQVNQLQAQVSGMGSSSVAGVVGINSNLSWQMMGNMPGVGKEMTLLQARQAGLNTPVTIGGYAQGDLLYQSTNTNGVFNNTNVFGSADGKSATRFALSQAALSTTAAIGQWVTGYVQAGDSNLGQGNTSFGNNNNDTLNIQDAYLVVGNLAKNPVYGFVGKKDIDFGSFATVDMYAQPLNRQLFSALGNTVGVGVNAYGFNGTLSGMNGGTNGQNLSTQNPNAGKNFAVNLGYGMTNSGVNWNVGAGYLNGSIFQTTSNGTNGAWDLNGKVSVAGFDFLGEYTMTAKQTYGLQGYTSSTASRASAWSLGADYNFPVMGLNSAVSAEYSSAKLNGGNSNQFQPKQVVLGYRVQPVNNVWTGLEYDWNRGNLQAANSLTTQTVLLDVSAAF